MFQYIMDGVKSKNSRQRSGIIYICIVIIRYYEFKNLFELISFLIENEFEEIF